MKRLTNCLGRSLQVSYITLIGIFCLPCLAFGIEPIGTIGQPLPEQHAFLSNDTILRVVPTHIQVVDVPTGTVIDEFGERTRYSDVVLSPTATHLAILNHSGDPRTTTVNIWDVNARNQIMARKFEGRVSLVAFSPTAPVFATSFKDAIYLWNWQTGKSIGTIVRINSPIKRAIAFSTDGHHLMIVSRQPAVELWNVETFQLEERFEGKAEDAHRINKVVMSPNREVMATFKANSDSIGVWDIRTQRPLWQETSGKGRVSSMSFSPDSERLYVTTETSRLSRRGYGPWLGWDDQVRVWDVKSGRQMDAFGTEFTRLEAVALSPDEKTALLHYHDAVILWDIQEKQPLNTWVGFIGWGFDVGLSPDGKTLISASRDFIKIWDVPSGQLRRLVSAEKEFFEGFAISPDSKTFAIVQSPWVQIRDIRTGKVKTQFPARVGYSYKITFSPSGRWIAADEDWGNLFVLDAKNAKKFQKIQQEHIRIYYGLAFSKNDEYLAAVGVAKDDNRWILVWKRERDAFVFQYKWQVPELSYSSHPTLAFATDTALAVSIRGAIQIWKLLPDRPRFSKTLDGEGPVYFTSNSRYLFTNRNDKLQIWDWREGTVMDYPSIPAYFALSWDGSVLLSHMDTGQIQSWDGNALLPSQYCPVLPHGKQLVLFGDVKHNQLLQNFPNPFNPETWIPFRLATESPVTIQIYSSTGQLVRRLSPGVLPAGDYSSQAQAIHWNGRNQIGEPVSSGVYLYTISAGDFSATRKMLIRK